LEGSIIHSVNINSVNLNLLLAFEALLEEQNVSRAATRIGISQPAMSNALARLRELFNDPLFRRTSRGMKATSRALELAGPVRNGLTQLRGAFADRPLFDPRASTRSFRLAMTDYAELVLLGPLLQSVARAGGSTQIVVRRVERIFLPPEEELRAGSFDAAIGFYPDANSLDPHTRSLDLFAEQNVCIARKGHPLLRKGFTLRHFVVAGHIGVFYRDETVGLVDNILAGYGLRRRLLATTPHFLSAVCVVAKSDLIAIVPAGLAARFQRQFGLEIRRSPVRLPTFHMRLLWNEHNSEDPALEWLRSEIVKCVARVPPTRGHGTAQHT
jgi:DNA-binding transcriptional LysR family regulator